ncbi:MAG: hypothetical protein WCO63_12325 [Bacteroidota bacterium]
MKSYFSFKTILYLFFGLSTILFSCKNEASKNKVITERIQYDVLIKSPGPDYDWWVQNLEGPARENLVRTIIQAAYNGKVKAYDPEHKLLTPAEVKAIGNRTDTVSGTSPNPPYNDTVMIMQQHLDLNNINRIRYLEEWTMDETTLKIEKKILGIAVIQDNYDEKGAFRGLQPLFWVYFDENYPGKFELK